MNGPDADRRNFLRVVALAAGAALWPNSRLAAGQERPDPTDADPLFRISLAQWSLHRTLYAGELDPLDFPAFAREKFDLDAVEYVNTFFKTRARDEAFLKDLKQRCEDAGVRSLLIMVDGEGRLGDPDDTARAKAIENHHPWADAAKSLGGHSIRVNAASEGTWEEQRRLAADGLHRLAEYAAPLGLNVIVENHGGLSSNGQWLAETIRAADHPNVGTLPDFGNFLVGNGEWYDRYKGVEELMPMAKAVSAKSHEFDQDGNEKHTDYRRMMRIVLDAGYRGYVGIEYEGSSLPEVEGIAATKRLLERVRAELTEADRSGR